MRTLIRKTVLWFCEGTSDKVYIASVMENNGVYEVVGEWGRRGKTLQSQIKGRYTTDWQAHNAYLNLVDSKRVKGYEACNHAFA